MKKSKRLLATACLALLGTAQLSGCASLGTTKDPREPASVYELVTDTPELVKLVANPQKFNETTCAKEIGRLTAQVYEKPSEYYAPTNPAEIDYLMDKGPKVLEDLFKMRLVLENRLRGFRNPSAECVSAMRKASRFARFAEDFLAEWLVSRGVFESRNFATFTGGLPYTQVNPKFRDAQIRAGDLILMRGQTFVSAMIARIGDDDADFSHVGIVGQDNAGKLYMIEALIETGTIMTPLDEWLKREEGRAVLLRANDANLAWNASRKIYDHVNDLKQRGITIPYDFSMDPRDHSQLFCSEVVQLAFELATDGELRLPRFPTTFGAFANHPFLREMGITVSSTIAPVDVAFDPNFTTVAEYRLVPALRKIRVLDSALTSIFQWMTEQNYRFTLDGGQELLAGSAFFLRQMGIGSALIQKSASKGSILAMIRMHFLMAPIEANIIEAERAYFEKNGHSLTSKDLLAHNEAFRRADCAKFRKRAFARTARERELSELSKFHWRLNAPNGECQE